MRKEKSGTLGGEDHVPCLARSIIAGDLGVEQASTGVRILGFELVDDHSLFLFLRFLLYLSSRSLCLSGGHLGSDRN